MHLVAGAIEEARVDESDPTRRGGDAPAGVKKATFDVAPIEICGEGETMRSMGSNLIFSLKLLGRKPDELTLDRVAGYLRLLAQLLGVENRAGFQDVREGSVVLAASVEPGRVDAVNHRLMLAQAQPGSKWARPLRDIEDEMRKDGIADAQVIGPAEAVLCRMHAANEPILYSVSQVGEIDGEITGVVGVDDTLHVRVRDLHGRDVRLTVRNLAIGRDLARAFRGGPVRLHVHGQWNRTDSGWAPDGNKCFIDRYETLDPVPPGALFTQLRAIPGNGWTQAKDAIAEWSELRGLPAMEDQP